MKSRNGFVSNSSSSSFIVAADPEENPKVTVTLSANLDELDSYTIESAEELANYFDDIYGKNWKNYDDAPNDYKNMIQYIESGKVLYVCTVSSDSGDSLSLHLYDHGVNDLMLNTGILVKENW